MNLKIHLLIIVIIITALYFAKSFLDSLPKTAPETAKLEEVSKYHISIVRASWGLNCLEMARYIRQDNEKNDIYSQKPKIDLSRIVENNVFAEVSNICTDKPSCTISNNTSMLGEDPMPVCGNKYIQVEYRCFDIDKLRGARTNSETLTIDCDKEF